ncbi:MAG: DDE-type integrase/transposase/recombinase, partial [Bacteroidota bacterium]
PESHYAPVEGEALALTYGLENCRIFVLGCPNLILAVDHKPLTTIFSDQPFERVTNPRLFDFKQKTLMYRFTVKHIPGKIHLAPDCGSRYPVASSNDSIDSSMRASIVASYTSDNHLRAVTWDRIVAASATDEESIPLSDLIKNGFPDSKDKMPSNIRQYWNMRDELYQLDGVPIKGSKILIPKSLRAEVLQALHAAHQGVNGMLANARQRLFWPGLDASVRLTRAQCKACNKMAPSNPRQPLQPPANPDYPFQQTVTDFFDLHGKDYLIYADRYTGWVEIALMTSGRSQAVCDALRKWFVTYGAPEELSSDGGPPFQSYDYDTFLKNWGIYKRLSAAYNPQSNGRAELAVKSAKRILTDNVDGSGRLNNDKVAHALLAHRNTPVSDLNISPAVMLFGRPIRDHLPALLTTHSIRPEWSDIRNLREAAFAKRHMRNEYF